MSKALLVLMSVSMFVGGCYLLLSRRHLLLLLLGGELLLQATALNFIVFSSASAEAQLVVICLLVVAVAEAVLVLALAVVCYREHKTMHIDILDREDEISSHYE